MNNKFTLIVTPPHSTPPSKYGRGGYTQNTVFDARWEFADGVKILLHERSDYHAYGERRYAERERELCKPPRVYVDVEETLLENWANRSSRPYLVWKPRVIEALTRVGLEGKLRWSARAGCTMCPCSPGFILETGAPGAGYTASFDVWVTLPGAPVVTEGSELEREWRLVQICGQL